MVDHVTTRPGRSSFGSAAFGLTLLVLAGSCVGDRAVLEGLAAPGAAEGQNLVLITLDTTRADRLGAYGHDAAQTPYLDDLAATGIRFDQAITSVPITLPAHATILTGLLPPNHGARDNAEYRLSPDALPLPEILREAGYQTAAFVSAFVLESRYGLDRGFDLYEDEKGFATIAAVAGRIVERRAGTATNEAIAWLAERDPERPFFLWVHYFDPHMPYSPPAPWSDRFPGNPYDGEIAYMDAQIGRLLAALDDEGLRDDTLIAVVADHGEGLGDHGESTHAMLIYDSVMRVPMLLSGPSAIPVPGVVDEQVVSTADLHPTLLSMLGIEDPVERDGFDLTRGGSDPERSVYIESAAPYLNNGWSPLFGLRRASDKFILAPTSEYYDLAVDPGELVNRLLADDPESRREAEVLARDLDDLLAAWPTIEEVADAALPVDSETLERLRALGYVGGGLPPEPSLRDPKEMMPVLEHIHRASSLLGARRPRAALAEIEQAYALSPNDRMVLETKGAIHLMLGEEAKAEAAFRAFTEIRPSAEVCAMLAQILLHRGAFDDAHAMLDQAESLNPHHGVIHLTRGDLLIQESLREQAIDAWERARRDDPTLSRAVEARIARIDGGS